MTVNGTYRLDQYPNPFSPQKGWIAINGDGEQVDDKLVGIGGPVEDGRLTAATLVDFNQPDFTSRGTEVVLQK